MPVWHWHCSASYSCCVKVITEVSVSIPRSIHLASVDCCIARSDEQANLSMSELFCLVAATVSVITSNYNNSCFPSFLFLLCCRVKTFRTTCEHSRATPPPSILSSTPSTTCIVCRSLSVISSGTMSTKKPLMHRRVPWLDFSCSVLVFQTYTTHENGSLKKPDIYGANDFWRGLCTVNHFPCF